jgi:hypothetical protein
MAGRGPRQRIAQNPFYVLGLAVDCSRAEIEREGQKLLGMLALDLAAALTYRSPLGEHPRTAEAVREAMAELRDPERRLMHEMWARLQPGPDRTRPDEGAGGGDTGRPVAAPWPEAMAVLGWQRPARRTREE